MKYELYSRSYKHQKDCWGFSVVLSFTLKQYGTLACYSLFQHKAKDHDPST